MKKMSISEEVISNHIYKNLFLLSKWKEPTPEFMKLLSKDMFMKPNPKAFPHVMHHLFNILDSKEFKKNFFWPILNKKSEAEFRSSTIFYLNYLKEKHKLAYETVKSHIVVLPGGIRFMKVLFELSKFIIQDILRKFDPNQSISPKLSLSQMLKDLRETEWIVDTYEFYKEKLIENTNTIKTENEKLTNFLKNLFEQSSIDECLKAWKERIENRIEKEIEPELKKINHFNEQLKILNQSSVKLLESGIKNRIDCDENAFKNCLIQFNSEHFNQTEEELLNQSLLNNNKINFSTLFNQFEYILPFLLNNIFVYRFPSPKMLNYEEEILRKHYSAAIALEIKLLSMDNYVTEALVPVESNPAHRTNIIDGTEIMNSPTIIDHPGRSKRLLLMDVLENKKNVNASNIQQQALSVTKKSAMKIRLESEVNQCKPSISGYQSRRGYDVLNMASASAMKRRIATGTDHSNFLKSSTFLADTTLEATQLTSGCRQKKSLNSTPDSILRRRRLLNMSLETSPSGLLSNLVIPKIGAMSERKIRENTENNKIGLSREKLLFDISDIDLVD